MISIINGYEKLVSKYNKIPKPAKASIWFFVCSFLQKGISFFTTPIFSRLLTTTEYGQYNTFTSWTSLLTVFITLELSSGVYTQGLIKFEEDKKRFSSSLQGITLCFAVVWLIIYLLFRKTFNSLLELSTIQVISMIIIIWSSASFGFWSSEQRNEYQYKALVCVTLLISVVKPIIEIVTVVYFDDKVTARIVGTALVDCLIYSTFFFVQIRKGKTFYSRPYWKYAITYNVPLIPHYLSQTILISGDRIMIQRLVGADYAGIYSLAYSIAQIMTLINTALNATLGPWIYKKIKANKASEIGKVGYLALSLVAIANVLLLLVAPEMVAIMAPPEYADAISVIPPIAMSAFFMFSYNLFAKFEFYYEKTRLVAIATALAGLLNICLNFVFIPILGYTVAGYTTLFCYVFYSLFHYMCMRKILKSTSDCKVYDKWVLLLLTFVFVVISLVITVLFPYPFIRYGLFIVVVFILIIKKNSVLQLANKIRKQE